MSTRTFVLSLISCLTLVACKAEAPKAAAQDNSDASKKETPKADATKTAADHASHAAHAKTDKSDAKAKPSVKRVFFVSPAPGAKVKSPVKLVFGVEGMGIRKAGEDVNDQTTGHHHIIVDGGPVAKGAPVPKDATHIHYGGGQTETELALKPGKHTLTMQLADGAHRSYGKELSATLELEVTE